MRDAQMKAAQLGPDRLAKVRSLEKRLGCWLLALEPEFHFAELSAAQVKQVKAAEKRLGLVLLAYALKPKPNAGRARRA